MNTIYTPEKIRDMARDHVAYGWSKRPGGWTGPAWTPEQTAIYNDEFDKAKHEAKQHAPANPNAGIVPAYPKGRWTP